ncbi:MAG TPA: tetratricopeptide repeat protein, partial [Polyangiaceae bacterium]|nr:tetratricopeptide repeat protein [Polyangiaceae bacterium]
MKARNPRFGVGALGAALAIAATAPAARADDSAAAQALFDQAKKAMAVHDYAEACPKFEESLKLQEAVGTMLNLADCYEHQGKLASAWSKFLEVATKARAAGQAQRARIARDRATALAPKLSHLVIDVPSESRAQSLEVRRDGTVVGEAEWGAVIPADAGSHTIDASAPGRKPWSQTVAVPDGAATSHASVPQLDLVPPPSEAKAVDAAPAHPAEPAPGPVEAASGSNAQRTAGILATSVGVAGIGAGAVFGLLSLSDHGTVSRLCPAPKCASQPGVDASNDAITFGNISTAAFIVGGVGLAAGLTLWLSAPRSPETRAP